MNIIPAIDLLGGEAVRLYQGSYDDVKSYSNDPAAQALKFQQMGTKILHVVDLDAARWKGDSGSERKNNRDTIRKICDQTNLVVEVGGGIRSDDDIRELLDLGVRRLIIGTLLVKDPDKVARWVSSYDADFIAGIDARDGDVKIAGWEDGSRVRDEVLAATVAEMGMKGIIYTNIALDGTLTGPDIEGSFRIAEASGLPVVVSGGMGSMTDCANVYKAAQAFSESGKSAISGVILGKALYEGAIDLESAIELYQGDIV